MKNLDDLKRRLIEEEGLRLKPYRCSQNKLTIGVGRNIEERGISQSEALKMLDNDVEIVVEEITEKLPWILKVNTTAGLVLMDMAFNMGVPRLLEFKNTLGYVRKGEYKKAAVEMLDSRWAGQVPLRAKNLSDLMAEVEE